MICKLETARRKPKTPRVAETEHANHFIGLIDDWSPKGRDKAATFAGRIANQRLYAVIKK